MDEHRRQEITAAALEQLPHLVAVFDAERLELLTATDPGQEVGQWSDALRWELREQLALARSGATYGPVDWRVRLPGSDGVPVEVRVAITVSPVRDPAGAVVAVTVSAQDPAGADTVELEERHVGASEVLAQLHDAVLPTGLPVPQQVEIAARYLLAKAGTSAGGDWFDAIPLADGRVVVAVGDVVGHGVEASVVMIELKTLFDEKVREDGDIVAALELLDSRAHRVREARSATVCVCVLDTRTGELTYCTAGHPPPVLVTADGSASYLPTTGAGPLCSGQGFAVGTQRLGVGDQVLLYSDGLIERPGRTPAQGTVELLQVVEGVVAGHAERTGAAERLVELVCRQTLEVLTRVSGYADDITVLALQVAPSTPALDLHVLAVPDAVRSVRADLGDWLARLRVTDLDRMAVLHAVGELVSNAVSHAYRDADPRNSLDVTARLTADGLVEMTVSDRGRWRDPDQGEGGRGLAIASGFLDELEVVHDAGGTRARGRHRLNHPATLLRGTATASAQPRPDRAGLGIDDDVLHLAGSIDQRSADDLRHACARASRGGTRPITINLAEVDLLSSAAVQALYDSRAAGPVDLVAPVGSPAQHVLDLVRLPYRS